MPYKGVLFDLFRTVILFDEQAPTGRVHEPRWREAMGRLRAPVTKELPDVDFEGLLDAIVAVADEIARGYAPEFREVPSQERYRRALARLGVDGPRATAAAERLSALQMGQLAAHASVPRESLELLRELRARFRLALISNFDHAPTIHVLLERHALAGIFHATVISDELGRRKPHPVVFHEAVRRLGVEPGESVHVGDALVEDVGGARGAGIDVVWLNAKGIVPPSGSPLPTHTIRRLSELRSLLR